MTIEGLRLSLIEIELVDNDFTGVIGVEEEELMTFLDNLRAFNT